MLISRFDHQTNDPYVMENDVNLAQLHNIFPHLYLQYNINTKSSDHREVMKTNAEYFIGIYQRNKNYINK